MNTPSIAFGFMSTACLLLASLQPSVAQGERTATASQSIRFHAGASARGIPFRYELGHIIVAVTVADSMPIDMMLDTGLGVNGAILLDPALGEALGLSYSGQVPLGGGGGAAPIRANVAQNVALSLPGVTFANQTLLVVTDPEPHRSFPTRGILGKTPFDCAVEIDYETGLLHLYEAASYRPPEGATPFETTFTYGIPVMEAAVSTEGATEIPVKLIVDTGAVQLLLFPWTDSRLRAPASSIAGGEQILSKGFTGTILGSTGRIARLKLGPHVLREVIASFPDSATWGSAGLLGQNGMLGNDGLRRFFVAFDYSRQMIHLKPNAQLQTPFETDMSGIVWEPAPEGSLLVLDVIPNSPATESGIAPGDVILSLNGQSALDLGWGELEKLLQREGVTLRLWIARGGQRLERTIVTRRLI